MKRISTYHNSNQLNLNSPVDVVDTINLIKDKDTLEKGKNILEVKGMIEGLTGLKHFILKKNDLDHYTGSMMTNSLNKSSFCNSNRPTLTDQEQTNLVIGIDSAITRIRDLRN